MNRQLINGLTFSGAVLYVVSCFLPAAAIHGNQSDTLHVGYMLLLYCVNPVAWIIDLPPLTATVF